MGTRTAPPLYSGRLTWIVAQLAQRFDEKISVQTVARWARGEARPRQAKNVKLAQLLDVDPVWLYVGLEPEVSTRDRRTRDAMADGAVNVVAGLIQMDGGIPAFPDNDDERAIQDQVHLYAAIKGAQYAFHIVVGAAVEAGWMFTVPADAENVVLLGVVREGLTFHVVELNDELLSYSDGTGRGMMAVTLDDTSLAETGFTGLTARV